MRSTNAAICLAWHTGGHSRGSVPSNTRDAASKEVQLISQGMLVNWDAEKIIWNRVFSPQCISVRCERSTLIRCGQRT